MFCAVSCCVMAGPTPSIDRRFSPAARSRLSRADFGDVIVFRAVERSLGLRRGRPARHRCSATPSPAMPTAETWAVRRDQAILVGSACSTMTRTGCRSNSPSASSLASRGPVFDAVPGRANAVIGRQARTDPAITAKDHQRRSVLRTPPPEETPMRLDLDGRSALVTGASAGNRAWRSLRRSRPPAPRGASPIAMARAREAAAKLHPVDGGILPPTWMLTDRDAITRVSG